jgi:hypothetical protein
MYIGMYAYDTVNTVDDDFGFDAYNKNTGLNIDTDPVQGNFYNNKGYVNFVRDEVIAIIRFSKCKVILNAFKNVVTSFSIIGYIPSNGALNKISFVFGAFSLFLLIYNKLYLILFTILTYNLGFILYFPPISAYNLGVLFPLAFGLIMLKRKLNLSSYYIKSLM